MLLGGGTRAAPSSRWRWIAEFRADAGYIEFAEASLPSLSDDVAVLGATPHRRRRGRFRGQCGRPCRLLGDAPTCRRSVRRRGFRRRLRASACSRAAAVGGGHDRDRGWRLPRLRPEPHPGARPDQSQGPPDAPGQHRRAAQGLRSRLGGDHRQRQAPADQRWCPTRGARDPASLSWIVPRRARLTPASAPTSAVARPRRRCSAAGLAVTTEEPAQPRLRPFSIGQGELS